MTSKHVERAVRTVIPMIVEQVSPLRILLFGSAVRDRVGKVNDLDFLVVVPDGDRPNAVMDQLNMGVRHKPMPCDFLVATPSMLATCGRKPGSIYSVALTEGREVYAC